MNCVEINTRAYVATRLLLCWDYLYAVTLKTKVFGDYNHARLEVSWITSTQGLLLRGYTGRYTSDFLFSLIALAPKTYSSGDSGHPWRTPRDTSKNRDTRPLLDEGFRYLEKDHAFSVSFFIFSKSFQPKKK